MVLATARLHSLRENSLSGFDLTGRGFSRADKPVIFVIPSRSQPNLRGQNERGICSFRLFSQPLQPGNSTYFLLHFERTSDY